MNEVFANQTLAEDGYGKGKSMINKLVDKIKKTGAPIVVGLDPMLDYVPEQIKAAAFSEFGETPAGAAEAIWQYNKAIVDATYDLIPAVKPQIAMYEQFGVEGVKAFQKTVDYCHRSFGPFSPCQSGCHQNSRRTSRRQIGRRTFSPEPSIRLYDRQKVKCDNSITSESC